MVSSMRNQLSVTINAGLLEFVDASDEEPAREDFCRRVAQVADYMGSRSDQTFAAVGFAFTIEANSVYEELPSRTTLNWLVNEDALAGTGYEAIGASARLWYAARDRLHDLRIEPKGNQFDGSSYFAGMYVHIALEGTLPSGKWLAQALNEEHDDFRRVLGKVLTP